LDPERVIFYAYLLAGPIAWVLMFVGLIMGRARMSRLLRTRASLPQNPPKVTILVPAKDEGAGIRRCIEGILRQDYPDFEVIAIDDRSTDDTGPILDELAKAHPKVRVVHIAPGALPDGWLGKCNALWTASRDASGEWLFFVDSDVTIEPGALARTLALAIHRRYDAVSILTRLECRTFWERLVLPLAAASWSVMFTISQTNEDNRPHIAAANGQFFLIRRSAYEAVGGHEAVRDQITEDVELMRLLKGRGFRTRLFMGAPLASTRMHSTLPQMFHGWARIYAGTSRRSPWRIVGAIIFYVLCGLSVYPALAWGIAHALNGFGSGWLIASLAHLTLMSAYLAIVYRMSGTRARGALLFPLGGAVMLGIFAFAIRTCYTGRVKWRGTHFSASGAMRVSSTSVSERR
jgi:cellulose synthase/poly-beta-1,6-N-acetylglucosamine synthase-like glycosyltransferase